MLVQRSEALGSLTSAVAGTGVPCGVLGDAGGATISGTFVGTVAIEISADGTNYVAAAAALTAPGFVAIPRWAKKVRMNCTAYTSGTIVGVASLLQDA